LGGAAVVVALLLAMLVPPLNRAREQSRRTTCANNMRQLGQAMMIYASVNGGRFPDRLERLLSYVPSSAMVCPSTSHTAAAGQTPQLQAVDLAKGGHLSYVYVGDAYVTNAPLNPATTIVLYEPLANHRDGIDVLYADGHVAFLPAAVAAAALPGSQTARPSLAAPASAAAAPPAQQPAGQPAPQPAGQ
jgi:prepilin-type processing-associated H-X9-DG protein